MFIRLICAIGTKYSLPKGLGTQYRDVSENEVFHFAVLSVRGPALLNRGGAGVESSNPKKRGNADGLASGLMTPRLFRKPLSD